MPRKTSNHPLRNALDSANIGNPAASGRGVRAGRGRKARIAQAASNRRAHKRRISPDNFFVVIPVLLVGTGFIWLFFAVVFGGFGGHMFSSLSKAEFLIGSKHKYHETHEAMLAEHKLYKQKKKEWEEAKDPNSAANRKTSAYESAKSGTIIYQEEIELRETLNEVKKELRKAEDSGVIAKLKATQTDRNLDEIRGEQGNGLSPNREELVAALEKQKGKLEQIKKGEYKRNQNRADSDKDILRETNRIKSDKGEKAEQAKEAFKQTTGTARIDRSVARTEGATNSTNTTASNSNPANINPTVINPANANLTNINLSNLNPTSVSTTLANRVRIDFLENNCAALTNDSKSVQVEYRKGSAAIKGSSLDDIDGLIKIARACGETKLSVYPTEAGVIEDEETDRDLLALRNSEVKYYLLMRRIPKENILLFDTLN